MFASKILKEEKNDAEGLWRDTKPEQQHLKYSRTSCLFYHVSAFEGHRVHCQFIHFKQHPVSTATALMCDWGRRGAYGDRELFLGMWWAGPNFLGPLSQRHPQTHPSHRPQLLKMTEMFREASACSGGRKGGAYTQTREQDGRFSADRCVDTLNCRSGNFLISSFASMGAQQLLPSTLTNYLSHWWPQRSGDARPLRWVTLEEVNAQLTKPKQIRHLTPVPVHSLSRQHLGFGAEQQHGGRFLHTFTPVFPDSSFPPSFCLLFHLCAIGHPFYTQKNKTTLKFLLATHTQVKKKWNFFLPKILAQILKKKSTITTWGQHSWCIYIITRCNLFP